MPPRRVSAKKKASAPKKIERTTTKIARKLKRSGQAVGRNETQKEKMAARRQLSALSGVKMTPRERSGRSSQG
jgi:hypothetical protein